MCWRVCEEFYFCRFLTCSFHSIPFPRVQFFSTGCEILHTIASVTLIISFACTSLYLYARSLLSEDSVTLMIRPRRQRAALAMMAAVTLATYGPLFITGQYVVAGAILFVFGIVLFTCMRLIRGHIRDVARIRELSVTGLESSRRHPNVLLGLAGSSGQRHALEKLSMRFHRAFYFHGINCLFWISAFPVIQLVGRAYPYQHPVIISKLCPLVSTVMYLAMLAAHSHFGICILDAISVILGVPTAQSIDESDSVGPPSIIVQLDDRSLSGLECPPDQQANRLPLARRKLSNAGWSPEVRTKRSIFSKVQEQSTDPTALVNIADLRSSLELTPTNLETTQQRLRTILQTMPSDPSRSRRRSSLDIPDSVRNLPPLPDQAPPEE